jgi:hypothetical protein
LLSPSAVFFYSNPYHNAKTALRTFSDLNTIFDFSESHNKTKSEMDNERTYSVEHQREVQRKFRARRKEKLVNLFPLTFFR